MKQFGDVRGCGRLRIIPQPGEAGSTDLSWPPRTSPNSKPRRSAILVVEAASLETPQGKQKGGFASRDARPSASVIYSVDFYLGKRDSCYCAHDPSRGYRPGRARGGRLEAGLEDKIGRNNNYSLLNLGRELFRTLSNHAGRRGGARKTRRSTFADRACWRRPSPVSSTTGRAGRPRVRRIRRDETKRKFSSSQTLEKSRNAEGISLRSEGSRH